jgi:hypothetical protein
MEKRSSAITGTAARATRVARKKLPRPAWRIV